jgi:hypothetical protein
MAYGRLSEMKGLATTLERGLADPVSLNMRMCFTLSGGWLQVRSQVVLGHDAERSLALVLIVDMRVQGIL